MFGERGGEARLGLGEGDAVLRPLRARHGRLDGREVELQHVGEHRLGSGLAPQPLGLAVGLHQRHPLGRAAGRLEVLDGVGVDGEEAAGCAVLRRHVADGGAILHREMVEPLAAVLDELLHHAVFSQHLRAGQHEVGGGHPLLEPALEAEADHLGDHHRHRLAQHGGLGLDAAHAPAEHAQRVDHGGMAVGADAGIGESLGGPVRLLGPHGLREILEVDLVADAGARRHDAEIVERAGAPAQELVALLVALVLDLDVLPEGVGRTEEIHLHGMVDYEVDRHQRVDPGRVAAQVPHGIAHGGEIDDRGHAREVLHQHARRTIGDLARGGPGLQPVGNGADVVRLDRAAVLEAQEIFEQDFQGDRQPGAALKPVPLRIGKREILVGPFADGERPAALEAVGMGRGGAHDGGSPAALRASMRTLSVTGWPSAELRPYKAVREVLIDATTRLGLSRVVLASPVLSRVIAPRAVPPSRLILPSPCQSGGDSGGNFSAAGWHHDPPLDKPRPTSAPVVSVNAAGPP